MSGSPNDAAVAALLRQLARLAQHNEARAADPILDGALARLGNWQANRLRVTYADLERSPRYAPAVKFFRTDLYGGTDFARRDADLVRVVPAMKRLLPAKVIETVAVAAELNALSHDLDRAMIGALPKRGARFSVVEYCVAYRAVGRDDERKRQIALIGDVGVALDRYVAKSMVRKALWLMRKPARMAGLVALQDFLERGFAAFAHMRGAVEFLATIETRETAIHDAIVGGDNAPFPEPAP